MPTKEPNMKERATNSPQKKGLRWRLAARLGFWFFFIKGMLWLILPALGLWFGWEVTHQE